MPPPIDVVGKGTGADLAETVEFGNVFDGNDGGHGSGKEVTSDQSAVIREANEGSRMRCGACHVRPYP